jgi:hypothetical protein
MTIQIEGLNSRQQALCDIIWACDSKEQVLTFVRSLPTAQKREAEVMVEMMTWAFFDTVDTVDDLVKSLIDKVRK